MLSDVAEASSFFLQIVFGKSLLCLAHIAEDMYIDEAGAELLFEEGKALIVKLLFYE